jgi:DNA-binding NtrC family response regulator
MSVSQSGSSSGNNSGSTSGNSGPRGVGGDFLTRKSDVIKTRQGLPSLKDVLIVEDDANAADRLRATLHVMLGYNLVQRRATTLGSAVDCVIERKPEVVFLDDYLKPSDNASHTIPFLRRAGYTGPIIVISGARQTVLMTAGAIDVIHKDDLDSVRIAEALNKAFKPGVAAVSDSSAASV